MTAKVKVDLDIRGDRYKEFTAVLKELIGYEGTLKLDEKEEQLAQKFASFFPRASFRTRSCRCFSFSGCDADPAGLYSDLLSAARSPKEKNGVDGNGNKRFFSFLQWRKAYENKEDITWRLPMNYDMNMIKYRKSGFFTELQQLF